MAEQNVSYAWIQIQTADGATYPFAIDPASYVKRDIVDFAPRSGGGDVAYSNLDLYQLVTQDSWHHGIGFVQFRDKFGYRITSDGVDTRQVGMALMFSKYSEDYNYASNGLINCVDFGGSSYFNMGAGGVWKRTTTGVWTKVYTATVAKLLTNGAYLIASLPGGRMATSSNGTSWSSAGVSGNPPNNFSQLDIHNGFMWGSESATSTKLLSGSFQPYLGFTSYTFTANESWLVNGNGTAFNTEIEVGALLKIGTTVVFRVTAVYSDTMFYGVAIIGGSCTVGDTFYKQTGGTNYDCVHFWSSADSSDAEGGGINDIGAITIGAGSPGIRAITSFNGALHVARPDGVWAIDDTVTPPVGRRVLSFADEQHSSNFAIFVPWRGRLYFNIKNALYAYNGSSLANVTPPTYDLNYPPSAIGGFISATYRGPFLYILASDNQATPHYYLMAFDGTGWFVLLDLGTAAPIGIGYSPLVDQLFIGITGGRTIRVPFQAKSELPYADFDLHTYVTNSFSGSIATGLSSVYIGTLLHPTYAGTIHLHATTIDPPLNPAYDLHDDGAGVMVHDIDGVPCGTIDYSTGSILVAVSGMDTLSGSYDYRGAEVFPHNHYLNMSEIDFGFRRVKKSFAEIDLEVYNVAASRYVAIDYSADGGAWSGLGYTVASGVTQFNMNPTVEANKLDVRLNFQTGNADQSPILRNVTIKAMIRPDTLYGHQMVIIGANEIRMLDNRFSPGSSEQQRQWIEAVRNSKAPVTFIDHFGVSHQGYLSTAQFQNIERRPGESQSNWACRINLVEVR